MDQPTNTCVECGHEGLTRKAVEIRTRVGRHEVRDAGKFVLVCDHCGEANLTSGDLREYELRAARCLLSGNLDLIDGDVLRDVRRSIGITQTNLGQLLNRDAATISRYESGSVDVPPELKLAMAALVDRVLQHGDGALDLSAGSGEYVIAAAS